MYIGVPHSYEEAAPYEPAVGICVGPYGGPWWVAVSYERGAPVMRPSEVEHAVTPAVAGFAPSHLQVNPSGLPSA